MAYSHFMFILTEASKGFVRLELCALHTKMLLKCFLNSPARVMLLVTMSPVTWSTRSSSSSPSSHHDTIVTGSPKGKRTDFSKTVRQLLQRTGYSETVKHLAIEISEFAESVDSETRPLHSSIFG